MFKKMKLQTRLLTAGCIITALPLLIVSAIVYKQNGSMMETAVSETTRLTKAELERITKNVYALAESHQKVQGITQKNMKYYLNVAGETAGSMGGILLNPDEKVTWSAVNQFTQSVQKVELPQVTIGGD